MYRAPNVRVVAVPFVICGKLIHFLEALAYRLVFGDREGVRFDRFNNRLQMSAHANRVHRVRRPISSVAG